MTKIIIAVISSSVLSAILTSIFNWRLHNANYKKDYYKKILDKRLDAFEKVQSLTGKLSIQAQLDDCVIPTMSYNEEFYQAFVFFLSTTIDSSFWLDNETSSKLTELNVFLLNNFSNNINHNLDEDLKAYKYQTLGNVHSDKLRQFRKDLQSLINKELKHLHKVDKFFSKNKDKTQSTFSVHQPKYVSSNN